MTSHRILIDGFGRCYDCGQDDTLLRAALRAGLPFPYELQALPGYGERIRYYAAISESSLDGDDTWTGPRGFVHELVERELASHLPAYEFYFAGPPPMVRATQEMLARRHGVPPEQIHYDSFN